ncbi:MAG: hypothetical protein ACPGJE_08530, partial [Wenzhouxiangellaceae bacterium]
MTMRLWRGSPALTIAGLAFAGLALVLLALLAFDTAQVLNEPRWLKPVKFAASISIYLLTMAWFCADLERTALVRIAAAVFISSMSLEQIAITFQAARETTSHFNAATPLDASIYAAMGISIIVNTIAAAGFLALYWKRTSPPRSAYAWGVRFGLILFILGSLEGYVMVANNAHTVGAPDGGPGIPILRWSTEFGDLRIAHFIGIH